MTLTVLKISSVVGGPHWVDPSDGTRIFELVRKRLIAGEEVSLDFSGKEIVITAFLNAAIGPLYSGDLSAEQIGLLSFSNTTGDDSELIKRVCENAKIYYSNKSSVDKAWSDEFDEE